jgi:hypothetical protein
MKMYLQKFFGPKRSFVKSVPVRLVAEVGQRLFDHVGALRPVLLLLLLLGPIL